MKLSRLWKNIIMTSMKPNNALETLWESYDFYLGEIEKLEAEYTLITKNLSPSSTHLAPRIKEVGMKLDELYRKHLHGILEIKKFYKENSAHIPPHREVSASSLDHLYEPTARLLQAQAMSCTNILNFLANPFE